MPRRRCKMVSHSLTNFEKSRLRGGPLLWGPKMCGPWKLRNCAPKNCVEKFTPGIYACEEKRQISVGAKWAQKCGTCPFAPPLKHHLGHSFQVLAQVSDKSCPKRDVTSSQPRCSEKPFWCPQGWLPFPPKIRGAFNPLYIFPPGVLKNPSRANPTLWKSLLRMAL